MARKLAWIAAALALCACATTRTAPVLGIAQPKTDKPAEPDTHDPFREGFQRALSDIRREIEAPFGPYARSTMPMPVFRGPKIIRVYMSSMHIGRIIIPEGWQYIIVRPASPLGGLK